MVGRDGDSEDIIDTVELTRTPYARERTVGHPPHEHPLPHLIHVVTGEADLAVDGKRVRLEARDNLWLAPQVTHAAAHRRGSIVLGLFLSPTTTPSGRYRILGQVAEITTVLSLFVASTPACDDLIARTRARLDDILTNLDLDQFPLARPTHPIAVRVAEAAAGPESLAALAGAAHMSVRQVQRIFVAETGLTAHQWRVRARLNLAVRRLRAGNSLQAAAISCGYATEGGLLKALARELHVQPQRAVVAEAIGLSRHGLTAGLHTAAPRVPSTAHVVAHKVGGLR